jgi:hypothetical protein
MLPKKGITIFHETGQVFTEKNLNEDVTNAKKISFVALQRRQKKNFKLISLYSDVTVIVGLSRIQRSLCSFQEK